MEKGILKYSLVDDSNGDLQKAFSESIKRDAEPESACQCCLSLVSALNRLMQWGNEKQEKYSRVVIYSDMYDSCIGFCVQHSEDFREWTPRINGVIKLNSDDTWTTHT